MIGPGGADQLINTKLMFTGRPGGELEPSLNPTRRIMSNTVTRARTARVLTHT